MNKTFTKLDSQAMKGAAILLMFLHHLFYSVESSHGIEVEYLILFEREMVAFAQFCKICVPAFVFVTAYGMTLKYKASEQGGKSIRRITVSRYVSLMVSFLFIYVLALIFCQIGGMRNWQEVYGTGGKSILYALIDMAGMTYFTETPTMNPTWWYMSTAVMLIFLLPFLQKLVERTGIWPVPVLMAVMVLTGLSRNQALLCILTALVGVWSAERDIFGKWNQFFLKKSVYGYAAAAGYVIVLIAVLVLKVNTGNRCWFLIYPISAFALAGLFSRLNENNIVFRGLCFLGKYSMGMFLTHTFMKSYYLHDFIYGFHYAGLIFVVLTVLSLALSVILTFMEEKFRGCLRKCFAAKRQIGE